MEKFKGFILIMMIISVSLILCKVFAFVNISSLSVFIPVALTTIGVIVLYFNKEINFLTLFMWLFMTFTWTLYSYIEYDQNLIEKNEQKIEVTLTTQLQHNVEAPLDDSPSRDPEL